MNEIIVESVNNVVEKEHTHNTLEFELINVETIQRGLMGIQPYEGVEPIADD